MVAIVDDDDLMRSALKGLMKSAGLPAQVFASAEEFLKSGQQNEVGCLVADIRMPGMSGLELQAKLNADQCRIPTIFITAHGDEKMRMQALRAGAVEFMAKPFDDEALLDSVRAALELHWGVEPDKKRARSTRGFLWQLPGYCGRVIKILTRADSSRSSATAQPSKPCSNKSNGSRPPVPLC